MNLLARTAIALLLTAGAAYAIAAEGPPSLLSLFNRIPDLPGTAQEAATWVDKSGKLVHPGLLALQADIEAHQQAVGRIMRASDGRNATQAAATVEDLAKGMADVGVDMQRMQRDPAYARQVQERMRQMSPQEMMALSQKMSQPMNHDKRRQNEAQAMVDDSAPVKAAAEAGLAYSGEQMARMDAHAAIWREADAAVARVLAQRLTVPLAKPAMAWDNIGCDAGCHARWDAYANQMLPLMVARDSEILQLRRAALQRQRAAVAAGLKTADQHLLAAQYGTPSRSSVNQMHIAGYDGAAVGELKQLLTRIEDSVKSAAVVVHCGKQAVLVPLAICQ